MSRLFGVSLSAYCGLICLLPLSGEAAEYRTFTAKSGSQIEAKVVGLGADKRIVKIERRDAQIFELEILRLSLTDQQYLKTFLETAPNAAEMIAPPVEYSLDVQIDKVEERRDRSESSYYKFVSTPIGYNLTLTNKTREPLSGATLQYFVLMDNQVRFLDDLDSSSRWSSLVEFSLMIKSQSVVVEELLFNRDVEIRSHNLIEEAVLGDGNYRYGADEMIGIVGVVKDQNGRVLQEFRSTRSGGDQYTFDALVQEFGEPASANSDIVKGRERRSSRDL